MINPEGVPYDQVFESEHFAIHWQDWVALGTADRDDLADTLEESLRIQTEELGFRRPDGIDTWQMVVVVDQLGPNIGGYAWFADCGDGWMPYMVLNLDLVQGGSGSVFLQEVVAHELFHTIQAAYGMQEFFLGWDASDNKWWVEASAAYHQGVVVPEGDEWLQYFSTLWSQQPWRSIETHDPTGFQYGAFVFPLSVEAELGPQWHREFWEQLEGRAGYGLPDEFDTYFQTHDSSMFEQWSSFLVRGAEGTFPRYEFLLGVRDLTRFAQLRNSTTEEYTAVELPVEGRVEAGQERSPESWGANYVWFGLTDAPENKRFVMHFEGDAEVEGVPVEWAVEFIAVRAGAVQARHSADPVLVDGAWEAHVRLDGIAGNAEGAYVIASPIGDFERSAGWGWAAELRRGTTDELGFSEADAGRGCTEGCETSYIVTSQGAGWIVGGLILGTRRRRGAATVSA